MIFLSSRFTVADWIAWLFYVVCISFCQRDGNERTLLIVLRNQTDAISALKSIVVTTSRSVKRFERHVFLYAR